MQWKSLATSHSHWHKEKKTTHCCAFRHKLSTSSFFVLTVCVTISKRTVYSVRTGGAGKHKVGPAEISDQELEENMCESSVNSSHTFLLKQTLQRVSHHSQFDSNSLVFRITLSFCIWCCAHAIKAVKTGCEAELFGDILKRRRCCGGSKSDFVLQLIALAICLLIAFDWDHSHVYEPKSASVKLTKYHCVILFVSVHNPNSRLKTDSRKLLLPTKNNPEETCFAYEFWYRLTLSSCRMRLCVQITWTIRMTQQQDCSVECLRSHFFKALVGFDHKQRPLL